MDRKHVDGEDGAGRPSLLVSSCRTFILNLPIFASDRKCRNNWGINSPMVWQSHECVSRAGFCVDDDTSIRFNSLFRLSLLGFTSVYVQSLLVHLLVGRPGLDPGTLRVFPECPGMSISVQICWPDEVQCPPTSTEVLSRLTSWLDNWLDPPSFQGQVTIQVREPDGEGIELRLGDR